VEKRKSSWIIIIFFYVAIALDLAEVGQCWMHYGLLRPCLSSFIQSFINSWYGSKSFPVLLPGSISTTTPEEKIIK
jgi:hypothetical protein